MLSTPVKNLIIDDFQNYKKQKARMNAIDNQINYYRLQTSNIDQDTGSGSSKPSDPTYNAVQEIEYLRKEKVILLHSIIRVECCLNAMTQKQRDLVNLKYFEKQLAKTIMAIFKIEKSEYYRRINEILLLCAEVCGHMTNKGQIRDKVGNK